MLLAIATAAQGLAWDINLYTSLYLAGLILVAVGLAWTGVGCLFPRDTQCSCTCRIAAPDELRTLLKFSETHLGPVPLPPEQHLRTLLDANPNLYYIVERRSAEPNAPLEIVGCFTILPLKQGAVDRLEDGEMHGAAIRPEHITKRKGAAKAFYIGVVIGIDRQSSAATLRHLQTVLDQLCRKHQTVKVFARPMTTDGLRLAKRHQFRNVIDGGQPEMNVVCYRRWEYSRRR